MTENASEPVAWMVEFQRDGLDKPGGEWLHGRPHETEAGAEGEVRYCVMRGHLARIVPLYSSPRATGSEESEDVRADFAVDGMVAECAETFGWAAPRDADRLTELRRIIRKHLSRAPRSDGESAVVEGWGKLYACGCEVADASPAYAGELCPTHGVTIIACGYLPLSDPPTRRAPRSDGERPDAWLDGQRARYRALAAEGEPPPEYYQPCDCGCGGKP